MRKDAIRESYSEQFLTEVQQWADQIIDLCNLVNEVKIGANFTNALTKRQGLIEEGVRLSFIKICGNELPISINISLDHLSSLPDKRIWNNDDVKDIRESSLNVKDIISGLRYIK
ncbi:hypothetical protein ACFLV8_02245 [Chloroflexota bacterium]